MIFAIAKIFLTVSIKSDAKNIVAPLAIPPQIKDNINHGSEYLPLTAGFHFVPQGEHAP